MSEIVNAQLGSDLLNKLAVVRGRGQLLETLVIISGMATPGILQAQMKPIHDAEKEIERLVKENTDWSES